MKDSDRWLYIVHIRVTVYCAPMLYMPDKSESESLVSNEKKKSSISKLKFKTILRKQLIHELEKPHVTRHSDLFHYIRQLQFQELFWEKVTMQNRESSAFALHISSGNYFSPLELYTLVLLARILLTGDSLKTYYHRKKRRIQVCSGRIIMVCSQCYVEKTKMIFF